jgi:hypothetical protein
LATKTCVLKNLTLHEENHLEQDITVIIPGHVGKLVIGVAGLGDVAFYY